MLRLIQARNPSSLVHLSHKVAQSRLLYHTKTQNGHTIGQPNAFENLIKDLKVSLDSVKTKEDVNIKEVLHLLRRYSSNEDEWGRFALRNNQHRYTRNLVTKISSCACLLVLVWEPGKGSNVHNHPESNCFMKVLKGDLQEDLYEDSYNHGAENGATKLKFKSSTLLPKNSVAYIADDIGLHRVNNTFEKMAVSLHLYVPEYHQSTVFDPIDEDGKFSVAKAAGDAYYSIDGKLL